MDKANELVARGADRHRAGRMAEAESHYRRALRLEPNHPDALNLLAVALRARGLGVRSQVSLARAVVRRFLGSPGEFFLAPPDEPTVEAVPATPST